MPITADDLTDRSVYISGPMTGLESFNFGAFTDATATLRSAGASVVSPHEMALANGFDPESTVAAQGFDYHDAMRNNVEAVMAADLVILLPGWERSPGALAELTVAEAVGVDVVEYAAIYPPLGHAA